YCLLRPRAGAAGNKPIIRIPMNSFPPRRFSRLHEQVLLSPVFSFFVGWCVSVLLPLMVYWSYMQMSSTTQGQRTAMLLTSVSFFICHIAVIRLKSTYPGGRSGFFITPQVVTIYALLALGTLLLRIEVSRLILVISGFSTLIWFNIEHLATAKYRRLKLAVVDVGNVGRIFELHNIDARRLSKLDLEGVRYDAVIADFHHLDADVERFLTACALNRIAVYDAKVVAESFSGRVKIDRMSENNIGALLPTRAYERMKLLIDWLVIVAVSPVVLPIVAVTATLIKLESPGPIIYTQTRVGQGNRPFTI